MRLSCVIPAYRRHPMTVRHVEECLRSTRVPDEIVVVNDGGDPCLKEMLVEALTKFPGRTSKIIYARVEEDILWNFNGAVNLGFWLSTGDIIAIEDTDHIPDRGLYETALELFDGTVDRVAVDRRIVDVSQFPLPYEEWEARKVIGPNQMTSLITRDLYLKLKGQDERFCGQYGYMAMSWHDRYNNILKAKTHGLKKPLYIAIFGDEGEPGIQRGMSVINRRFYRETSALGKVQHPQGILNFSYTMERM